MKYTIVDGKFYYWDENFDIWRHKEVSPKNEMDEDDKPIVHEDLIKDYERSMKGI